MVAIGFLDFITGSSTGSSTGSTTGSSTFYYKDYTFLRVPVMIFVPLPKPFITVIHLLNPK